MIVCKAKIVKGSTRRKFTPEFKAEAVKLFINSGKPVAKLLGPSESVTDIRQLDESSEKRNGFKEKPLKIDERARLKGRGKQSFEDGTGRPPKSGGVVCEREHVKLVSFAICLEKYDANHARNPNVLDARGARCIPQRFLRLAETNQSDREIENTELTGVIKKIDEDHKGRLGIDRLVAELAKLGRQHSPRRVRRLARATVLT